MAPMGVLVLFYQSSPRGLTAPRKKWPSRRSVARYFARERDRRARAALERLTDLAKVRAGKPNQQILRLTRRGIRRIEKNPEA